MKRILFSLNVLIALLNVGGLSGWTALQADEQVYANAVRSTVLVMTPTGSGSGVLVDQERRWIVTNEHVVESHADVQVFFPQVNDGLIECELAHYQANREQLEIAGKVIAVCERRDLALVELERLPPAVPAIPFGESAKPGQAVHSIGHPSASGALWVYTNGYVRANYFKSINGHRMQVVETSAPINPGDSGGPILNSRGQLVGISQSFHTEGRLVSNGVDVCEVLWFVNKHRRQRVDSAALGNKEPARREPISSPKVVVASPGSLLSLLAGSKR